VQGPLTRTDYTYDSDGNLTALIEAAGSSEPRITSYEYDSRGNLTLSRDAAGQTVRRTYSASNQLLTQTRYRLADPDGAGSAQPAQPETTRYVYDAEDHLRFTVSAEGRVSEFQYRTDGLRTLSRTFSAASSVYALAGLAPESPLSEAQLVAWVGTQAGTHLDHIDYGYDFRGQLASTTTYATSVVNGTPDPASAAKIQFVYDQRGQLLQSIDARGASVTATGSNANTAYATTYAYDGLGRLLTRTQWLSAGNLVTTSTRYDDAGYSIVTTLANALVSTATFDTAGQLRSEVNSSGVSSLGTVSYRYDTAGRLRQRIDANGLTQHLLYDAAGRAVATIDGDGSLTELVYDPTDRVVKTVRYADRLTSTQLASLAVNGQPSTVTLATLKSQLPSTIGRASDEVSRTVYDAAGRAVFNIDASGAVVQFFYDGAGRVTDTVQYAKRVSIAASAGVLRVQDVAVESGVQDRRARTLYNAAGQVEAQLDAAGYLTVNRYNGAGRLIEQIAYANATPVSVRATGTLEQLRPAVDEETSVDPSAMRAAISSTTIAASRSGRWTRKGI